MRVTDIVLQCGDTRGMQVGIDIGSESDGIVLQWEDTQVMQVGIDICNESDGYRLTTRMIFGG